MTAAGDKPIECDPNGILFSMPTVSLDRLDFVPPDEHQFDRAPKFYEDEWMQLEFFGQDKVAFIQQELTAYKAFEAKNRVEAGWKNIYARTFERGPVLQGEQAAETLAQTLGAALTPAPVLFAGNHCLGEVKNGFSIELNELFLYGTKTGQGILSLAALFNGGQGSDTLTQTFIQLSQAYGWILVD